MKVISCVYAVAGAFLLMQLAGCGETCDPACLETEICNADGVCEPIAVDDGGTDTPTDTPADGGTKCTIANQADNCGGYICLQESGAPDGECATSCKDSDDCIDGYECNGDTEVCEVEAPSGYRYIGIVSTVPADSDDDLNNTTPGPDIDAIEIVQDGTSYFATTIVSFVQGAGGVPSNSYSAEEPVLGTNDSVPSYETPGECNVDAEVNHWWSMGDDTAYLVVSFEDGLGDPIYIQAGSTVRIYELDNNICTDVDSNYLDTYDAYVGLATDNTSDPWSWGSARFIDSSMESGGVLIGTIP